MSSGNTNFLLRPSYQNLGTRAVMEKAQSIAANLKRIRAEKGVSQAKLAELLRVRLNTVQAIERGETKKSKYLPDIARVLGVPLSDIDPDQLAESKGDLVNHSQIREVTPATRDLPLHSAVEAGSGALVMSSEPIDQVERPDVLKFVKDAYAIIVVGESMLPVLKPGNRVKVHPHLPPKLEDICVFIRDRDGEFRATIKEYVGQTKDAWKVKRYYPKEETITLKKADWPRCDVVVSVDYR